MHLVIIESPYRASISGESPYRPTTGEWNDPGVQRNLEYLRAALRDSIMRGEAPIASHGLYTQPGVLNDDIPEERELGIAVGLEIGQHADYTVVYCDLGVSGGMIKGIEAAIAAGRPIAFRSLEKTPWIAEATIEAAKEAAGFINEHSPKIA